ncbi:GNAT family N-acetyltransferase [Nitrospirillum amazonense]|uniref:GNAT family N-acetyltransferase n=1 Tax=Nitrospirillum amazonense TaxID=28077 RepID=UPI002DD44153|nr:GNAT family N-acetyltransferase [Nitrospirillum amazonense]MEC4591632.1 GNAT family N-acetyltransferase [Nitrospirillum amazonense]
MTAFTPIVTAGPAIAFGPVRRWSAVYYAAGMLAPLLPWRDPVEVFVELERCFQQPHAGVEAAYLPDGRVIGVGCWSRQAWSTAAYSIHMASVLPEYRRQGIGAQLVERRLQAITEDAGGRAVWVDASTRCPERLARHGFRVVGEHDGLSRMMLSLPRAQMCGVAA